MKKLPSFEFPMLLILAVLVSFLPLINLPMKWFNTYFHEISHGIAALITGGSIKYIEINYNGSGVCATVGGVNSVIAFAGYFGAVLWGMAIYMMAARLNKMAATAFAFFLVTMTGLTIFFFAGNVVTTLILSMIATVILLIELSRDHTVMRLGLKFIGLYILVDSIFAPMHLVDGLHRGDGANLEKFTGLPEVLWVVIWVLTAVFAMRQMWIWDVRKNSA